MKVAIYYNKGKERVYGFVHYLPVNQSLMVTHPMESVRKGVRAYLKAEKAFRLPLSDNIGHTAPVLKVPTESIEFMDMALCEMFHSIGIHVDWNHEENDGGSGVEDIPEETINEEASKPIVKSVDGEDSYQIIN